MHLTSDSGVIKHLISKGTGAKPQKEDEVIVHYKGYLTNGTEFDSSYEKDDGFKFIIGVDHVIKGWDIGIMDMQIGEKAEIVIKPEYGYGKIGNPPKIPGDATLIFKIELLSAHERRPTKWMMNDEERIKVTLKLKQDGGVKFGLKDYKEAEGLYREAISHLDSVQNDNAEIKTLKKTILVNIAVVCNKSKSYSEAVRAWSQSLAIDPENAKAYYQRATAYMNLKQYDEAISDFKNAIKRNPSEKKMRTEYQKCKEMKKNYDKSQQNVFKSFFSSGVYNEKEAKLTKVEDKLPDFDPNNPIVFMDIQIGENEPDRVLFELFNNKVPLTAENFRWLCTGEKSTDELNLHFKDNVFHRLIPDFMIQGGDIEFGNGKGGHCIYGTKKFDDEKVWLPHTTEGLLSMANSGANTNNSQFFITFAKWEWLNQKHTVFGRVIKGMENVHKFKSVERGANDKPLTTIKIVDWGQIQEAIPKEDLELARYGQGEQSQEVPEESKVEI